MALRFQHRGSKGPSVFNAVRNTVYSTCRVFLMQGNKDKNELPSGINPAHLVEQHNLVSPLTCGSKTNALMPSV